MCYKNGEGVGRATAAAAAAEAAEVAEDESNERVVVAAAAEKGAPSTSTSASTTTTSGLDPEVAAAAAADWASIPWMTYRRGFPPIREESASFDDEGGGGGGGGGGDTSGDGSSGERSGGGGGAETRALNQSQNQRGLTSDVGWGCTLRSGQMLLAAAAQRVAVGRHWRRETTRAAARARLPPALEDALALFADEPGAPLSVHSLLAAPGVAARLKAERRRRRRRRKKRREEAERSREADRSESGSEASSSSGGGSGSGSDDDEEEEENDGEDGEGSSSRFRGLTPGEWLGPYTFCRAAEAALRDAWPSGEGGAGGGGGRGGDPPMRVLVVGGGGGGAPALDPGAAARSSLPPHSPPSPSPLSPPPPPPPPSSSAVPLLVLVPVQAGLGRRINPVYAQQVAAALRWPQSVGVVGGRRGASLYFVGTASLRGGSGPGRASSSSSSSPFAANERSLPSREASEGDDLGLLYLDPHVPRPAVLLSSSRDLEHHHHRHHRQRLQHSPASSRTRGVGAAKASPPPAAPPPPPAAPTPAIDPSDFFSDAPPARPLPLCSADPSLALGFLCADDEDYGDLVARAARLAARNPRWPLVSVMAAAPKGEEEEEERKGGGMRRRRASPSLAPLSRGQERHSQQEREDAGDWELL